MLRPFANIILLHLNMGETSSQIEEKISEEKWKTFCHRYYENMSDNKNL